MTFELGDRMWYESGEEPIQFVVQIRIRGQIQDFFFTFLNIASEGDECEQFGADQNKNLDLVNLKVVS